MLDSVSRYISAIPAGERASLSPILRALADNLSSQTLTSGALAQGSTAQLAKVGSVYYGIAGGKLVTKAANTDMAAYAGTVTNAYYNVFVFTVDQAGTLATSMGTQAATLAGVKFPPRVEGTAVIGFVIIHPTGTGDFVGGTTSVVDATVVPNIVYVNTVGAFDGSVVL